MASFLLFQLYGPMQAWGEIAVGEIRPSAHHPTRSGVFGLLAAALGIRRHETDSLQALRDGYAFALRLDAHGSALLDYHTIQTLKDRKKRVVRTRREELGPFLEPGEDLNTILSRREYLTDAVFTVCLTPSEEAPPYTLSELSTALQTPRFIPCLGRRSCPLGIPCRPMIVDGADLQEAFAAYPADENLRMLPLESAPECVAEQTLAPKSAVCFSRRDLPADFNRRQFSLRSEYRFRLPQSDPGPFEEVSQ